jgi:hypothetical protein
VPLAVVTFALTLLLKQVKLRTSSGLERPSEDVALGGGMPGAGDAEADEGVIGTGLAVS